MEWERNWREPDEEKIRKLREQSEKDETPPGWEPSPETIRAISGEGEPKPLTPERQEIHKSPETVPEKEPGGSFRPSWDVPPAQKDSGKTDASEVGKASKYDIPSDWEPSPETIEAISGKKMLPGPTDIADVPAQKQAFRDSMSTMTSQERGEWGEHAVLAEARGHGHRILVEHADKSTIRGYDCVSWDGRTQTLHIWEVKNYSFDEAKDKAGVVQTLSALDADKILGELPADDPDRTAIVEAVQQNRVQCHIRLGPDTDVSFTPLDRLVGWGNVDAKQYNYAEMLRVH
jgi:hypothetical protein